LRRTIKEEREKKGKRGNEKKCSEKERVISDKNSASDRENQDAQAGGGQGKGHEKGGEAKGKKSVLRGLDKCKPPKWQVGQRKEELKEVRGGVGPAKKEQKGGERNKKEHRLGP